MPGGEPAHRVGQRAPVEVGGGAAGDQGAGLGEVLPGGARHQVEVAAGLRKVVVEFRLDGLDEHQEAGEALGEGVVDLAGHPLPFGERAPLGREPGHFLPAGLQLGDEEARSLLWSMIRMIQTPKKTEKARVAAAKTPLENTIRGSGRHSSAHPATGTRLTTATAAIARRTGSSMKQCGARAKVISRVSPTRNEAGRNSRNAGTR